MVENIGLILGTIGTVLGISNFFRDRAKLAVYMKNNWRTVNNLDHRENSLRYTIIEITNSGRRPISIDNVFLIFPNGESTIINEFLFEENPKILEGEVKKYSCNQNNFPEALDFKKLQACIRDSSGNLWYSKSYNLKGTLIFFILWLKRYINGISY